MSSIDTQTSSQMDGPHLPLSFRQCAWIQMPLGLFHEPCLTHDADTGTPLCISDAVHLSPTIFSTFESGSGLDLNHLEQLCSNTVLWPETSNLFRIQPDFTAPQLQHLEAIALGRTAEWVLVACPATQEQQRHSAIRATSAGSPSTTLPSLSTA